MPLSLYLLALAVFAMGTSEFMLAGLIPAIAASFGVPVGTAGLLTSTFAVGMIIGAPLMAILARRWPPRASLVGFVTLFAATQLISAVAPSFTVLLITRTVAAVANAGFLAVALSTATTLVAATNRGRALAVLLSGTTLATIAGVPGGALVGTLLDWRATFWAITALCVPAALGVITIGTPTGPAEAGMAETVDLRTELGQLGRPRLLLTMLLGGLINAATFAGYTFLAPIVTDTAGLGPLWVPIALVAFGVGSFLGVSIAGRFADRHSDLLIVVGAPTVLLGWCALSLLAAHPPALLILITLQGLASFAVGSTVITRVLTESAMAPRLGGAYATVALNVGAAVGPIAAAGTLAAGADALGPIRLSGALIALALPVAFVVLRLDTTVRSATQQRSR